jgi:hypothetical protein
MATKNRTVGKKLAVTNSTIYTAPTRFEANIESIIISNASSAAVKVSLDWYDSVSLTYHTITELLAMAPNSMVQIKDGFWLQPCDTLRGLATVVDVISVSVRVREEYLTVTPQ